MNQKFQATAYSTNGEELKIRFDTTDDWTMWRWCEFFGSKAHGHAEAKDNTTMHRVGFIVVTALDTTGERVIVEVWTTEAGRKDGQRRSAEIAMGMRSHRHTDDACLIDHTKHGWICTPFSQL